MCLDKGEQLLVTTEMRMLRRIMGVMLRDRNRSEEIRKELGVCNIKEKVRQSRCDGLVTLKELGRAI